MLSRKRHGHFFSHHRQRTVVRRRQMLFGAVIGLGIALAACGGGGSVDLSPVATKVQVATNGFSFPNFPATAYKDEFDASDVTSMFGSGPAVCVSGTGASCKLTAEAAAFARMVNQSRASGHCEGLAAVALNRFDTSANPPTVKLPDQDETIHTIMRAFATQFVPEAQADVEKWLNKSLEEKIAALVTSFKSGKLDFTLGVYVAEGGHALLPYAVEFPTKDTARIMVYDTNWPGKNRYVEVDLKAKKWRFSFSGTDPENDPDEWSGGAADMDLTSFESRTGTCPFCGDGTKTNSTTMLVRTTNLDWSVEANGQVLKPGGTVDPASGVVVKPVKGLNFPTGGLFTARQKRSVYDYIIQIPNKPAAAGAKKQRSKLKFSGTTSLFAVTPTGIAQVNTPGNPNIPVEVGETSIVSKDPAVQLTLASGNLVASASGPSASLETSASGTMEVTVTAANGQVVKQEVNADSPAAKVTADATGGVTALVAAASGEVVKREVSSTGVETKTTSTESLDLNATTFKAPPGLESKPIEALPSLEKRNLANPEYKADAPYVAPTTTTTIAAKNKALEPAKTTIAKFLIEPAIFGDAPFTVTEPTSNSNAPFTYASSDPTVATVGATTGKVTIVGAGSTVITASQDVSSTYTAASITASLKVAKATPKLGPLVVPKKIFGDDPFVVKAPVSTNPADVVFESSNEAVAKINASTGKVTIVGAGTTTFTASQAATANYEAISAKATFTVTKGALVIASNALGDLTYGAADLTLTAPAAAGNSVVSFASTTPEVATVDANTGKVTIVGAGAASLRINLAATSNFEATGQIVTFNVKKATPRFGTFAISTRTFGDQSFAVSSPTSTSSAAITFTSSNPAVATISTNGTVSIVGAGSTTITATQAANANYESATTAATFVVNKAVPTLTITAPTNKSYGASDFALSTPTTNSTGAITYSSLTTSIATVDSNTGVVHLVGTGTATIQVSIASTTNYESSSTTTSFTALKATPVYGTFTLSPVVATTSSVQITAPTSTSVSAFTYTSSNTNVATVNSATGLVTVISSGTTTITAAQVTNSLHEAGSVTASLDVTPATPVFGQFVAALKTYGDASFSIAPPVSTSSGAFTFTSSNTSVATVSTNGLVTIVGAGNSVITATQAQTSRYSSAYSVSTLVVAKATPVYGAFSFTDRVAGGSAFNAPVPVSTSSGAFTFASSNSSVATVTSSGSVTIVAPGTTVITASQAGTANYETSSVSATLTVLKPTPTLGPLNVMGSVASQGLRGVRYVGYFADNVNWFATATPHGETNSMSDFTYFSSYSDMYSWQWTGSFVAPSSGSYRFCTNSDDASYLWIGSNADSGFTTSNSLINNGGLHGMRTICGTTSLVAGTSYPLRLQFGENGGGDAVTMSYAINGGGAIFNGTGNYFSQQPARVGDANYTIANPSSTSNGAFTYASSNPAVATVNSITGEVSVISAGTTTITATQAATSTYASTSVSQILTVGKGVQAALTAAPATCASGGACAIGDVGPGGGTVVYATSSAFASGAACATNCKYIEVAPVTWNGASSDPNNSFTWDCAGTATTATNTGIGAGYANTALMATNCPQATAAATIVHNSTFGGQTDWYIPSSGETSEIYGQRLFVAGYQSAGNYWSSTESSSTSAYQQRGSTVVATVKTSSGIVRPVRSFAAVNFSQPFKELSVAIQTGGGSGTGTYGLQVVTAGTASCVVSGTTVTAQMSGSCTIQISRAGDANWLAGASVNVSLSFYGPAVTSISTGYYHSCSVNIQGGVSCWGYGGWGLLGNGTGSTSAEPVTATGLTSGVTQLALGQHHSCALMTTGGVKCWGHNGSGQLGSGGGDTYSPVNASTLNFKAQQIVAGHQHTCALTTTGGVKCWGWNGYGQLGDGSTVNRNSPVDVIGLSSGVIQISADFGTTCAITENFVAKCWGRNDQGQLGDGTYTYSSLPVTVQGLVGQAKSIDNGLYNTCAVTTTGGVKCWGYGGWGQLGNGTYSSSPVPVDVTGLTNVSKVSLGEGHACSIDSTGAAKCWGRNEQGQLGDGTYDNRAVPVTPSGLTTAVSDISTGMYQHTCAVVDGGTVKCWGYNGWGQLGDSSYTSRITPVDVVRLRGSRQTATTLGALILPAGSFTTTSPSFTLAAPTSSRNETISFESSNPSVATINSVTGQVTIVGAGRTSLAASIGGNGEYSSASSSVELYVRPPNPQGLSDCQLRLSCNVGDIGPGGGRIFYVDTLDQFAGVDYLEAAPADVANSQWCDNQNWGQYSYGPQNPNIGMYNMQAALGACTSGAARVAAAYTLNGYNDWYLPSTVEMQRMVSAFTGTTGTNGFVNLAQNSYYWTSVDTASAYAQAIGTAQGNNVQTIKTSTLNVRPVRAFASFYTPTITTELSGFSTPAGSYEYLHAPFDVTRPTSLSGGLVTFASNNTAVASIDQYSARVTHQYVGSVTFTASQPAWAGFSGSSQSVNYTVDPSVPTLTGLASPVTTVKTSSAAFALTVPTSQSNGAITYSSSNTSVVTVTPTGAIVNVVGSGQALITATQAADGAWGTATQSILINVAKSCADGGACVVGDTGPGGGVIYYAANTRQSWGRYLEAAPSDLTDEAWCNTSQDTVGARETRVGFGQANSNAVVASCSSGAAVSADSYTINGKSDWYLPGFDELEEMYRARTYVGMSTGTYWSSTEDNSSAAKRFDFTAGVYISGTKAAANHVRAIRSVEGPADGLTAATAGVSATQLMMDNGYTGTGNYFIKPQGYTGQAVQLWCDFTHVGGGWALIGKGRQSNDYNGGWFGTESAINTAGLLQANAANDGISKVSSEFVNYLMNGSTSGWTNSSPDNYLIANRITDATDNLGGVGDSWKIKITNESQFKWVNQFGATGTDQQPHTGYGQVERRESLWLSGSRTQIWDNIQVLDMYSAGNDGTRLFTWHWGSHGEYHGWSAGAGAGNGYGFMNGGEGHAIQFVQLWAR